MTYTQFVSTMNHLYVSKGADYLIETVNDWFNRSYLGYSIGLLEYCCNKADRELPADYRAFDTYEEDDYVLTESMQIMCDTIGHQYLQKYIDMSIPEFIKHKVCITEVGNAV